MSVSAIGPSPRHIVLMTVGSAGDVFPMVGLGSRLQQRGYRVTLITNEYFEPIARKQGLAFQRLGTAQQYFECIQNPDLWSPGKGFRHIFQYLQPFLEEQHKLLVSIAAGEPTLAIASCLCFGARVAQESHQIPLLTAHLQPAVIWSRHAPPRFPGLMGPRWLQNLLFRFGEKFAVDPIVAPTLNAWRSHLGLAPMSRLTRWWNSPDGVLCLFPEWYAAPQPDWPQPLLQSDFPLWNDDSQLPLSEEVRSYLDAGTAPIVFTPGTANIHGREFFAAAQAACGSLQRRAIFLTRHPEQLPTNCSNDIRHFDYVPLDLLLPRAAAFVHHGGIGSTSQALLAGIPQVATPLAHDQFDNAARIQQLGVGTGIPGPRLTAARLTDALRSLLDNTSVKQACAAAAQRLSNRSGLDAAVELIEARFSPVRTRASDSSSCVTSDSTTS